MNPIDRAELLQKELFKIRCLLRHNDFPAIALAVTMGEQTPQRYSAVIALYRPFLAGKTDRLWHRLQRLIMRAEAIESGISSQKAGKP